jgi:hypothetical protein
MEPMECLAVAKVPEGADWVYEIKLDGYRAIAANSQGKVILYSRRRKNFNHQYPYIAEGLKELPENTVVDGEVVALDDAGRPNFNLLQHSRSQASRICYFVFDLLVYKNRSHPVAVDQTPRNHEIGSDIPLAPNTNRRVIRNLRRRNASSSSRARAGRSYREAEGQPI